MIKVLKISKLCNTHDPEATRKQPGSKPEATQRRGEEGGAVVIVGIGQGEDHIR